MAFSQANLAALVQGNGFTLWRYTTSADNMAAVAGSDYFDAVSNDMLRVGDVIVAKASDTTAMLTVTTAAAGNIVVGDAIDLVTAVS